MSLDITDTLTSIVRGARRQVTAIRLRHPRHRDNADWLQDAARTLGHLAGVVEALVTTVPAVSQQRDQLLRLGLEAAVSHAWTLRNGDDAVRLRVQWERPRRTLAAIDAHDLDRAEAELRALQGDLRSLCLMSSATRQSAAG